MNDKNLLPNSLQPNFLPIFIQICLVLIYIKLQWAFISKTWLLNERNNEMSCLQFSKISISSKNFELSSFFPVTAREVSVLGHHPLTTSSKSDHHQTLPLPLLPHTSTLRDTFFSFTLSLIPLFPLRPLHPLPFSIESWRHWWTMTPWVKVIPKPKELEGSIWNWHYFEYCHLAPSRAP